MCPGRFDGRSKLVRVDRVAARQQVDIREVAVAGGGVAAVDHGQDLLGEHGRQRIADQRERFVDQRWVVDHDRSRRDRIADVDVDPRRMARPVDGRRNDNADTGVQLGVTDHRGSQSVEVEGHAVIGGYCEDLSHDLGERVDVVGDRPGEEVDVAGRSALIEGGEQHSTLEHQAVTMFGDREAVEEALEHVEHEQLAGRAAFAAGAGLQREVGAPTRRGSGGPAHASSTRSAVRTAVEARSTRASSASRVCLGRGWLR